MLVEGGHIAEILHKKTGINPLWTPPWPSIEPSSYDPEKHPEYGQNAESRLLAGIMGHNLCLDLFGGPSEEEASAGITVHGEAAVAPYSIRRDGHALTGNANLVNAQLEFERRFSLEGDTVQFVETVRNRGAFDRPIAWTQHVTLGPPFIAPGETEFDTSATRSKTFEVEFGDTFMPGTEFEWPHAPKRDSGTFDLRTCTRAPSSAGYTAHLMDLSQEDAHFRAWAPATGVLFGYRWKRGQFPWMGIWEENHSRQSPPWNGKTLARGFEFGVSPMPETRRQMIERGSMFGVPAYLWIPAGKSVEAEYSAFIRVADKI
jgi:hypothetical protein